MEIRERQAARCKLQAPRRRASKKAQSILIKKRAADNQRLSFLYVFA
jgi:hypothetical protein